MADDVQVKFGANIGELKAAIGQVQSQLEAFANRVRSQFASLTEPVAQFQRALVGVAAVAGGGYVFKSFIDATTELASEQTKLSKGLGITRDEATVLSAALRGVGVSSDTYLSAAQHLDRQIRTNASTLERHGLTIRDSNGQLLSQQQIMQNAITLLGQFKAGTDRNIEAQTLFGRGAGEMGSLQKLNSTAFRQAAKDVEELRLKTNPAEAQAYKLAINQLELSFLGIRNAIGSQLTPYLTNFANWFRSVAPVAISGMQGAVQGFVAWLANAVAAIGNFTFTLRSLFIDVTEWIDRAVEKLKLVALAATSTNVLAGPKAQLQAAAELLKALVTPSAKIEEGASAVDGQRKALEEQRQRWLVLAEQWKQTILSIGNVQLPPTTGTGTRTTTLVDKQARELAIAKAEGDRLAREETIRNAMQANEQLHALDIRSSQEFLAEKLRLQTQLDAIDIETARKKMNAAAAEPVEYQKLKNELLKISQAAARAEQQIQNQQVLDLKARYTEALTSLQSSWDAQLRGMLSGTTSFVQAIKNVFGDMVIEVIKYFERLGIKWAATQLAGLTITQTTKAAEVAVHGTGEALKTGTTVAGESARTAATVAGVAARTGAEQAGMVASLMSFLASIAKTIAAAVSAVFAGVSAFFAPTLGPLAPAAAAPVAAGVAAAAVVPGFAAGAYSIDRDMLAMVHKDEMIVPPGAATAWRKELDGRAPGGGKLSMPAEVGAAIADHVSSAVGVAVRREMRQMMRMLQPALAAR